MIKLKKCSRCQQKKPLSDFPNRRASKDGRYSWCKLCSRISSSNYYHREVKKNPERFREMSRRWRKNNPEKVRAIQKRKQDRYRMEALVAYSGENPTCKCCGENEIRFLSIDHIDGGGNAHRRKVARRGFSYYLWLRKNKFPLGFQVLCHNCNLAKGFYGKCPHQNR